MGDESKLAIAGGKPVCAGRVPARGLITGAEREAVLALFDEAIIEGSAFGYSGPRERRTFHVRVVYKAFPGVEDVLEEVEKFQQGGE